MNNSINFLNLLIKNLIRKNDIIKEMKIFQEILYKYLTRSSILIHCS